MQQQPLMHSAVYIKPAVNPAFDFAAEQQPPAAPTTGDAPVAQSTAVGEPPVMVPATPTSPPAPALASNGRLLLLWQSEK